jgi:hypothetical protein
MPIEEIGRMAVDVMDPAHATIGCTRTTKTTMAAILGALRAPPGRAERGRTCLRRWDRNRRGRLSDADRERQYDECDRRDGQPQTAHCILPQETARNPVPRALCAPGRTFRVSLITDGKKSPAEAGQVSYRSTRSRHPESGAPYAAGYPVDQP